MFCDVSNRAFKSLWNHGIAHNLDDVESAR